MVELAGITLDGKNKITILSVQIVGRCFVAYEEYVVSTTVCQRRVRNGRISERPRIAGSSRVEMLSNMQDVEQDRPQLIHMKRLLTVGGVQGPSGLGAVEI